VEIFAMPKMKAAVFVEPGRIVLESKPVPEIGPLDALVRVTTTTICGTDVHIYEWNDWARQTIPLSMTIGHEFVGEIVEKGVFFFHLHTYLPTLSVLMCLAFSPPGPITAQRVWPPDSRPPS